MILMINYPMDIDQAKFSNSGRGKMNYSLEFAFRLGMVLSFSAPEWQKEASGFL